VWGARLAPDQHGRADMRCIAVCTYGGVHAFAQLMIASKCPVNLVGVWPRGSDNCGIIHCCRHWRRLRDSDLVVQRRKGHGGRRCDCFRLSGWVVGE
jgi:hypothetical protein